MQDLVVVANRLPVRRVEGSGGLQWETSPGGLVSALQAVLDGRGVDWVGWTGAEEDAPPPFEHDGVRHHAISLSHHEIQAFYRQFSNRTIWPLYHDAVRAPEFHRRWWHPYVAVNRRFAEKVASILPRDGLVWVHDYHLQLVPGMLREMRPDARISFFLHIPFPPMELFAQLPWRSQILEGLLGADLIGFQTSGGAQNFRRLALRFTEARRGETGLEFGGRGVTAEGNPISIDVKRFEELAQCESIQQRADGLRDQLLGRKILLGVDRLDYTKGIDVRLRALETLFERRPDLRKNMVFIQVAVPSRKWVEEYQNIRDDIERRVGRLNGTYGEAGMVPAQYLYRNLPVEELVAFYLAADVMVVTPLRDGMNLVAKEFVACSEERNGVLVLSEFAGAAAEFGRALQVNPHDVDGVAATLELALNMDATERKRRMGWLRRALRKNDVFHWATRCLDIPGQN